MNKQHSIIIVALAMALFSLFLFSGCSQDSPVQPQMIDQMQAPQIGDLVGVKSGEFGVIKYYQVLDTEPGVDGDVLITWIEDSTTSIGGEQIMRVCRTDSTSDKGEGDPQPQPEQVTWGDLKSIYR